MHDICRIYRTMQNILYDTQHTVGYTTHTILLLKYISYNAKYISYDTEHTVGYTTHTILLLKYIS